MPIRYQIKDKIYVENNRNENGVFAHIEGTNKDETTVFFENSYLVGKHMPTNSDGKPVNEFMIHIPAEKNKTKTINKYLIVGLAGTGYAGISNIHAVIIRNGHITKVDIEGVKVKGIIKELIGSYLVYESNEIYISPN